MTPDFPFTRDLVLIGGGHTHALVLRRWGMRPLAGVRVTLINPGPTAPYSGMLPGHVAGHYTRDELDIDLVRLARFAGARLIDGRVTGLDPTAQTITVPGRAPISFDVASLDIGITSDMPDLPGFDEFGSPAKPLGPFAARWDAFAEKTRSPRVAILGGGVAGAELSLAVSHRLRQAGKDPTVHLIDRGKVLSQVGHTARTKLLAEMDRAGITRSENAIVTALRAEGVALADETLIAADFVIGAAGAKPQGWLQQTGLGLTDGYISVDTHLQTSAPGVFAVGDCAHMTHAPRPKAGVFAVRQAPVLLENLRAALSGGALSRYQPQRDYLKLISLGDTCALAEKFGTALSGSMLWRWKDHIDRKFMRQFDHLPGMDLPSLPLTRADGLAEMIGDAPMCGGCGSKVGRTTLADGLGPNAPRDDAADLSDGRIISTDHLRAFWSDPTVMTRIAAIHALGDVWASGAKAEAMLPQIIIPRMSPDLQRRTLAEITEAARLVAQEAGAKIVGGHTSQGAEFHIGFTVTGRTDGPMITVGGATPGDALILTKPIGSGTIMAAEMRTAADGATVLSALASMQKGQADAAMILSDAHAMTDVTGFGLAGHLLNMCEASDVAAEITLDQVPLLDGALDLARQGIRSSLYPDNRAAGLGAVTGSAGARFDLMFDPQTAGGLLASVAPEDAQARLDALLQKGHDAAIIGKVTDGPMAVRFG